MQRTLIIAPQWIGDAVMSQPLLAGLKQTNASQTIDVLCTPWVAPIYRVCKEITKVIEVDFQHGILQWDLRRSIAKQLKANAYNRAFVLPNSFKSALIPWLAHIPFRIGYRGEMRFGLINCSLNNPSKVNRPPMAQHYLALSSLLEPKTPLLNLNLANPSLQVTDTAKQSVTLKLGKLGIDQQAIYVLCPGAEYGPSKRWPTEHFETLAKTLMASEANSHIILLGSKGDHALAQNINTQSKDHPHLHNWCGETSLDEAIALISMSKAMVSNDSGLMHIGAALHIPQVAIFGSSDPLHTPPLSDKAKVVWLHLPCSPCHKRDCPLGHLKCLKDILPENVFSIIQTLA